MNKAVKKAIVWVITTVLGLYGVLGMAVVMLPKILKPLMPVIKELGENFWTIPVSALLALAAVLVPMLVLVSVVVFINWALYRAFGLKW